ncbi:hypothetical protein BDV93DRAFT_490711 [Ceratobasidium sp. AG-I]|nr:hypothetical protein BDV93DRAFT_490711 [Ceratobasidium sp. AG-I]
MRPISILRILEIPSKSRLSLTRSVSNFRPPRSELGQHQVSYEPRERRGNSDLSGPSREGRPSNLSPLTRQDHTFRSTKRASERPPTAKSGPPREVHVAHTVKELCKEGKLDEAVEYCENTPVALQGPVAWNTVITYALQEKRYNFAYQQFLAMKKRAVVPTVPTYNLFLSAYAEADPKVLTPLQRERAQKIYSDWTSLVLSAKAGTSKGVDRSHPAAAYIDALANMGDFQAIWDVFYQLGSEGPLAPNEHVFTSMFLAIAKRNVQDEEGLAKIRARNAEDGKLIWRQVLRAVEKQPFPIDSHLVTSALRVLRHGGPAEHELAFTIIKDYLGLQAPDPSALVDISEPDVPLDTRAVDAALSVCMSADRHDLVHHFLNTLIHSKDPHRSRAVTTSAMKYALISYAAAGNTRQALETIDWMLRESGVRDGLDVKPGNSSWASAFRACIQTKDWSTAKALMQRLFGHDLRHWVTIPDAETMYLILHSAYVSKPSDRRSHELQIRETLSMIELVIRRWAPAPARLAEVQPARVKRRLDFHKKLADLVKQVLLEFEGLKNSSRWNALGRRLGEMQASLSDDPVAPNKGRS